MSVWGYLRVSGGVYEKLEGEGGLRGVSGSLSPSISFNFRKSQMELLTFSSRPVGTKCLKYQNVQKLR